jgi:hypothetical protein
MQQIPQATADQAMDLLNQSYDLLKPYLEALTTEDRRALPKIADGTEPFMDKSMEYLEKSGQFRPAYMNVNDVKANYSNMLLLTPFSVKLDSFSSLVSDTRMKAGSEALSGALQYYNILRDAIRHRIPGAKMIYDDLKKRFEKKKVKKEDEQETTVAEAENIKTI